MVGIRRRAEIDRIIFQERVKMAAGRRVAGISNASVDMIPPS
jgi:hypothetical protein